MGTRLKKICASCGREYLGRKKSKLCSVPCRQRYLKASGILIGRKAWNKGIKTGIPAWNKGKRGLFNHTELTKKRMSETRRGRKKPPFTEEHKRNIKLSHKRPWLGRKHAVESRRKIGEKHKGDKCHLWKGGVTKPNLLFRGSIEYKLWREAVFKRDTYTCVWCGDRSGNGHAVVLHADHIKEYAKFPELRTSIDNGRTLCKPCHKKRHRKDGFNINW